MLIRVKRWLKKTEQWLILLIYTLNRYKAPLIFKGVIIAKIFENWLDVDLLPIINRPIGI
jgi:hypothetical protein